MRVRNWFPPDFAQHGYISAVPRLHSALRFTYQPALILERAELRAADLDNPAHGLVRRVASVLPDKLFAWDLCDDTESILPMTPDNILRMQPELFEKFYRIVFGMAPTDVDPAWPVEMYEELLADGEAAAMAGCALSEFREERDAKNLRGG